jgi:hypothetical protein
MASVKFIAVKAPKDEVLQRLGLGDTGRVVDPGVVPLAGVWMSSGWTIVASNDWDFPSAERLSLLSEGTEAVGCILSSVVMASDAWGYRDGREIWSIRYDCEKHNREVEATGDLPREFEPIYAAARREQAENEGDRVDYIFDVPGDLVTAITGYNFFDFDEGEFTALMPPPGPRVDMFAGLKRLFGKK